MSLVKGTFGLVVSKRKPKGKTTSCVGTHKLTHPSKVSLRQQGGPRVSGVRGPPEPALPKDRLSGPGTLGEVKLPSLGVTRSYTVRATHRYSRPLPPSPPNKTQSVGRNPSHRECQERPPAEEQPFEAKRHHLGEGLSSLSFFCQAPFS